MNKTAYYTTGYFAYAQYDALKYRHSANCLSLRQRRNATNRVLEEEARTLEDSSPSLKVTGGDSAAPRKKRKKNGTEVPR